MAKPDDASNDAARSNALNQAEERFRLIYQLAPIGIAQVCLITGKILEVNDKLCQIIGSSRDDLVGRPLSEFVAPEDWANEHKLLDQMIAGAISTYEIEKRYQRPGREPAWVRVVTTRMIDSDGLPFRLSIVEDITQRKSAEAALLEREERMRAIVEMAVDAIITIDERGKIDSVNSAAIRLFGYARLEMVGNNVSMLMPQPDRSKHDGYLHRYVDTGVPAIIGVGRDVIGVRKDGSRFPVHLAVSEVRLANQRLFTGVLHDLTNRRKLERLVAEASASEQQRIGQDLHDGLGQQLAGLSFFCKSLTTRLEAKDIPEAADARRMNELITSALVQARGLAKGLAPVMAGHQGLSLALEQLATYVSSTFSIPCRFHGPNAIDIRDTTVATHAYRIAQEAVTNALKHAKPWNVLVTLATENGQIVLTIEDDGTGLSTSGTGMGSGREIMRARAAVIGGTLQIVPGVAGGTIVRCCFPQEPAQDNQNDTGPDAHIDIDKTPGDVDR